MRRRRGPTGRPTEDPRKGARRRGRDCRGGCPATHRRAACSDGDTVATDQGGGHRLAGCGGRGNESSTTGSELFSVLEGRCPDLVLDKLLDFPFGQLLSERLLLLRGYHGLGAEETLLREGHQINKAFLLQQLGKQLAHNCFDHVVKGGSTEQPERGEQGKHPVRGRGDEVRQQEEESIRRTSKEFCEYLWGS